MEVTNYSDFTDAIWTSAIAHYNKNTDHGHWPRWTPHHWAGPHTSWPHLRGVFNATGCPVVMVPRQAMCSLFP